MVGYSFTAALWSRAGKAIFQLKKTEKGGGITHCCTVCFTRRVPYSFLRCTQVNTASPTHIKSRSADKLVGTWPEIALIYGVITEFCCGIDMPGCLCLASCVWLITMKLSGLRGKQTGLMLPLVWCVWWHISCSNRKSYRHVILHCSLQYVCASRLRE